MANSDSPFGLRPKMHRGGAPYNGAVNAYYATDSTAIFIGDAVEMTGESYTVEFEGNEPGSLPIVKRATVATGQISGVVVNVQPDNFTSTPYRKASEGRIIWVCDDPDVLFEVQADGTVGDEAVGGGYNLIDTHLGSTVTGRSGTEMNSTTATGGTNFQLLVHRAAPVTGNDITTANSKWLVSIAKHSMNAGGVVSDTE